MQPRLRASTAILVLAALPAATLAQSAGSAQPTNVQISDKSLYRQSLEAAYRAIELYGELDRPAELERVQRIGYELAAKSRYRDFPLQFFLVDMPVPNAFALPGGQVFVTRGMLELGLDDDMLACLLGHELAHVTFKHGTRMQKRATLVGLLSQALAIGLLVKSNDDRRADSSDPASVFGGRIDQGPSEGETAAMTSLVLGQLLLLSYSREFETEADDEGQRLAAAAGYDPDGARRLWKTMLERIPLDRAYGYWRTHPFEDSRMRAAEERAKYLKVQEKTEVGELRAETQRVLLDFATTLEDATFASFLRSASLEVWPRGPLADGLRLEALHLRRDEETQKAELSRDYGRLIAAYGDEVETVAAMTPESAFLATARAEMAELEAQRRALYVQAAEVVAGGVYETAFLAGFVSNFPEAPELPRVAIALGDALSRLGQPTEAVAEYLRAIQAAPASPEAARARAGLRNLAAFLERLSALENLARTADDEELQRLASERLAAVAKTYTDLENGADFLSRYPDSPHADVVSNRLNSLAEKLYTEVLVYQGVGDHAKALARMTQILTHAPLSPAADQLRERTSLPT